MIGEHLFYNEFPKHAKSIYCNGKTYSREEFLNEREEFFKRKAKMKKRQSV